MGASIATVTLSGGPCDGQQLRNPERFLDAWDAGHHPVAILKAWHSTWHRYHLDENDRTVAHYIGPDPARWT